MTINGLVIPVYVRIRTNVKPHGGRRVEVVRIDGDALVVSIPGRDSPAAYRRSEVQALSGAAIESADEVAAARPWVKL